MTTILAVNAVKAARLTYRTRNERKANNCPDFPVLEHYLLTVKDGKVSLTSSILDGEPKTEPIPARVECEFSTCVPMRPFRDWLSVAAKYKEVLHLNFDAKIQTLTITAESDGIKSRTSFKCIDSQEYPVI